MKKFIILLFLTCVALTAQAQRQTDEISVIYSFKNQPETFTTTRLIDEDSILHIVRTKVTDTSIQIWQDIELLAEYPASEINLSAGKIYAMKSNLTEGKWIPVIVEGSGRLLIYKSAIKSDDWKSVKVTSIEQIFLSEINF